MYTNYLVHISFKCKHTKLNVQTHYKYNTLCVRFTITSRR